MSSPGDLIRALKELARSEQKKGSVDAALAAYEKAAALCRAEGDDLGLAHTLRHVGDLHRSAGRAEEADRRYREALGLYRAHPAPPPLDLANAIRPLAILRDEAGDRDESKRLWEEARDLYAAVGVEEGVAECSVRLARLRGEVQTSGAPPKA